jgi:DNA-binding transcriptional LysR family regulator
MDKPLPSALARRISFRQLQVFEAIARHENFTRAAEELFLTQPTVSMQIKKLEESVGTALFEHVGKKVFLTDIGKELFLHTRDIFESLAQFEMQAADMRGMKKGHLRLAVVTTAKYYAPRMLGIFCQKYPGIDVSLKVTNRERLLERLSQNMDDLYIIGRPPQDEDSFFIPLIENPLVVIASREHPLCSREPPLTFADIAEQQFIIRERGSGTRTAIDDLFANKGRNIRIKMEFGSNEAIKHAVASGLGISILSRHTMSLGIPSGPLMELDVEGFPISWPWYIGYHAGKRLSVVAKTFLDFVINAVDTRDQINAGAKVLS